MYTVMPYLNHMISAEAAEKELEELRKKLAESHRQSAAGEPMATQWWWVVGKSMGIHVINH